MLRVEHKGCTNEHEGGEEALHGLLRLKVKSNTPVRRIGQPGVACDEQPLLVAPFLTDR
jgi:hypothetical protein